MSTPEAAPLPEPYFLYKLRMLPARTVIMYVLLFACFFAAILLLFFVADR